MKRCKLAYQYHKEGFNCAQAVVGAFLDLIQLPKETVMAAASGFGGGVGGSHAELCGAISGGVMALSLLNPHTDGADTDGKKHVYALAKEFRSRFEGIFGMTCCNDLLTARCKASEKTPAALEMGITGHCDIMIVTAVEIIEGMLAEQA